jgi:RNA polymerase sigma factor for flagellar operon FliA
MGTQPISNYPTLGNPPAVPTLRRQLMPHRLLAPASALSGARREARRAEEKQRLLVELLPLVKRMALKIRGRLPSHVEVDDLVGNGVLGLVDAVSKFDTTKRVKLESYARHRVRGGILDGLRSADPASRDLRRKNKKIQKLYRELETRLGRPVEDEEIASAMGVKLAQWHRVLNEIQNVGFDCGARKLSAGPTTRPLSRRVDAPLLADDGADPFDQCYRREQRELLGRALSHLRERERQIITLYYEQELNMKQIAARMEVDESRVSQLHAAALARLRSSVNAFMHSRPVALAAAPALAKAVGAGL